MFPIPKSREIFFPTNIFEMIMEGFVFGFKLLYHNNQYDHHNIM